MKLEISRAAQAEVEAAAEAYERSRPGLGDDFIAAILDAASTICANPRAWATWPDMPGTGVPIRRFVMARFPFAIGFRIYDDTVLLVAVAHTSRRPGYWRER